MDNKLALIAILSVFILATTYFMSTKQVNDMFELSKLEINQVEGPSLSRKGVDSFKAEKLMGESDISFSKDQDIFEKRITSIEKDLNSIGKQCSRDIASYFRGKDIIDPNGAFYKDFNNIENGLMKLRVLAKKNIHQVVSINRQIEEMIQRKELKENQLKKVVSLINEKMDVCQSQDMDNFLITSMESMKLIDRRPRERKSYEKLINKLITQYLRFENLDSSLYRAIGLTKMAIKYGILEKNDEDYLENMHTILMERKDELQYQAQNLNDLERLSDYLQEEYEWRVEFTNEVSQYFAQNYLSDDY